MSNSHSQTNSGCYVPKSDRLFSTIVTQENFGADTSITKPRCARVLNPPYEFDMNSLTASDLVHPKYRADIDGLRAIAILSVVIFHAYPQKLPGGFVGVDVFFVISGFLISTIIFKSLEKNAFSFYDFYMRRARRIFPALFLVLACSFAFGWFVLLADEYSQLGKHIAAGAGFFSNFVLANESGYFDNSGETKPLLHLWSLGIEEQFYLFWPLIGWSIYKFRINIYFVLTCVVAISFALNVIYLKNSPVFTFYSPLTRGWELCSGAALAWYCLQRSEHVINPSNLRINTQAVLGIVLIGIGIFLYDKNSHFPGWLAVLPVLGAVLLILAGDHAWINKHILSNRLMVWFGLISFPLYLWHWPLLSFAHIIEGRTPRSHIRFQLILLAIALSWLTFRLIEKPIRAQAHTLRVNFSLILLMGVVGLAGYCTDALWEGLESRSFPSNTNPNYVKAVNDWGYPKGLKEKSVDKVKYFTNSDRPPEVLFIGDSHVEHFGPRVVAMSKDVDSKPIAFVTAGGPPIPNACRLSRQDCSETITKAKRVLDEFKSIKTIIVGACWNCYFVHDVMNDSGRFHLSGEQRINFYGGSGRDLALLELRNTLLELSKKGRVYLLLDNPLSEHFDPKQLINPSGLTNRLSLIQSGFSMTGLVSDTIPLDKNQKQLNIELQKIAEDIAIDTINQLSVLCPDDLCLRFSKQKPIYLDNSHIRPFFAIEQGAYIDHALK
jgi:peptidoglycan/LPS O-acetylase OafA/YrhL